MKTVGKSNGIFSYTLNGEWEQAMASLFNLSSTGTLSGIDIKYDVVKDFSIKHDLDTTNTFALMKRIAGRIRSE